MRSSGPGNREPLVWVIFLVYWLTVIPTLCFSGLMIYVGTQLNSPESPIPSVILGLFLLIFRGIGVIRLFLHGRDAWIYLGLAFLLSLAGEILHLTGHLAHVRWLEPSGLPHIIVAQLIGLGIVIYAYFITRRTPPLAYGTAKA